MSKKNEQAVTEGQAQAETQTTEQQTDAEELEITEDENQVEEGADGEEGADESVEDEAVEDDDPVVDPRHGSHDAAMKGLQTDAEELEITEDENQVEEGADGEEGADESVEDEAVEDDDPVVDPRHGSHDAAMKGLQTDASGGYDRSKL